MKALKGNQLRNSGDDSDSETESEAEVEPNREVPAQVLNKDAWDKKRENISEKSGER